MRATVRVLIHGDRRVMCMARPFRVGLGIEYVSAVPTIVLNGETRELEAGQTVSDLLHELGLDSRQVAVERNREIVPRSEHGSAVLAEGDRLEVVTFVGGG
jgi:sulfur carrier protein